MDDVSFIVFIKDLLGCLEVFVASAEIFPVEP
jgi:hypothetical protein